MRPTILIGLLLLTGCDFIGGGETVISGDDNLVVDDAVVDRVAARLARLESTPEVTDDDLGAIFATIRRRAVDGDLDASLVLLKIAAIQRQPADSENGD